MVGGEPKVFSLAVGIRRVQGNPGKRSVDVTCSNDTSLTFSCDSGRFNVRNAFLTNKTALCMGGHWPGI